MQLLQTKQALIQKEYELYKSEVQLKTHTNTIMKKLIWLILLAFVSCGGDETISAEQVEENSYEVGKPLVSVFKVEKTFKDFSKLKEVWLAKK